MLLVVSADQAVLNSRATPALLGLLNQLEGKRRWAEKGTQLHFEATNHNLSIIQRLPGVEVRNTDAFDVGEPKAALKAYQPVMDPPPYPHQLEALRRMRTQRSFGLFMEQGTGKTRVTIDRIGELFCAGEITGVLIITKKGVHRQWIEEELVLWLKGVPWIGQFWPLNELDRALPGHLQFIAINIDAVRTPRGMEMAQKFCKLHAPKMMIVVDESQDIKDYRTSRHKACQHLKQFARYRTICTGTPIAKDLTDEWAQLKWLDEGIIGVKYITTFRREYCIMGGFEGRVVVAHKNIEKFKAQAAPYIYRVTRQEIGMLPPQYARWHYTLTKDQLALMRSLRKELEGQLADGTVVSAANAVSALVKFQQVSSGFLINEGIVHRIMPIERNPKIQGALEYLDCSDNSAIVWFRFREEAAMLAEAFNKSGVSFVEYHGGINDDDRVKAVKVFKTEDGPKVFLANPQSGGTGLNLQGRCRRALYFSNSFKAIDRWQSQDRIDRIGATGPITFTDMVAHGSLDNYILKNIQKKKNLSDMALSEVKIALEELG